MASFLYRLGRGAFEHRRLTTAVWALILVAAATAGLALKAPTATSFSLPGTESQRALDLLRERFPGVGADGATARVVVTFPGGQVVTDPEPAASLAGIVADLATVPQVKVVVDPIRAGAISITRTAAFINVSMAVPSTQVTDETRDALRAVAATWREKGITVEVGGDAMSVPTSVGGQEGIGLLFAALILALTLGLLAAGLPLVTAIVGIGIGMSGVLIATHFMVLSSFTPVLALMLGLAVAIDYSLFIVSRYRHELATGREPADAAGRAVATAGSAVVFAGSTVAIALVALAVVNIPLLAELGVAAAVTVAISVVAALTLLPAQLGFLGRRLRPSHDPEADGTKPGLALRWARLVTRHPIPATALAALVLVVIAVPVKDLRLGLPDDSGAAPATTQRKAYDLVASYFGIGVNGPLVVVADATGAPDPKAAVADAAARIGALPNVVMAAVQLMDAAGTTGMITVIPASGPASAATENLVRAIRATGATLRGEAGTVLSVTGRTALNIDISARMGEAMLPYLLIVVGLAILLLMIVFRSFAVPFAAAAGFILSLAATLGALVAVFGWGWFAGVFGVAATGPILSLLPMLVIGVVFGLAMDYQVFLVSRMREEHNLGAEPTAAVVTGFAHGAKVVVAAALIMVSVFAGFILSNDALIKSFGFALAAAVLFDAFVVRLTIVPATMALLGKAAWWLPAPLARVLPRIDVEGAGVDGD